MEAVNGSVYSILFWSLYKVGNEVITVTLSMIHLMVIDINEIVNDYVKVISVVFHLLPRVLSFERLRMLGLLFLIYNTCLRLNVN